jgi:cytochrome c-type protein NapB
MKGVMYTNVKEYSDEVLSNTGIGLDKAVVRAEFNPNIDIKSCKSCHGVDWEKAALGYSKIVADMTKEEVTKALLGYKNGTYGRAMKGVMHTNVKMYSDKDLTNSGIGLEKIKEKVEFNPNIDVKSCKSCHGVDWEKAALGYSKIVSLMSKEEVTKALLGYKYGTYGRAMKGVMTTNVKMYSDEDLKNTRIGR